MSKVFTESYSLSIEETDLEILLRERLIKYLITRERVNISWAKQDHGFTSHSVYEILGTNRDIQFRYKIGVGLYDLNSIAFRLCNVSFSEKNRRKGILTDMMRIVEGFAPRFGYTVLQIENPSTPAIFSWMKKNGYEEWRTSIWQKKLI